MRRGVLVLLYHSSVVRCPDCDGEMAAWGVWYYGDVFECEDCAVVVDREDWLGP